MKQTENNEMDLVLRGLARREGARPVAPEDYSAEHLDADELNSYAEQVLPAAARARYTSHLAECASCRKMVSELTASSGANVSEHSVQKASTSLRQKFVAMFSPGTLRYAVPALALLAFVAVGLVALRQQTQPEFVAVNQPTAASPERLSEAQQPGSTAEAEKSAPANADGFYDGLTSSNDRLTSSGKGKDNLAKSGESDKTSSTPTAPADSVSVTGERDASAGKAAGAATQPSYAPEPAAPPAPKPQTRDTESRTEVTARQKREADKNYDEPAREQEGARARTDERQNEAPPAARRSAAVQSEETMRAPVAKLGRGDGVKAKDDEADTRTVSGRRFRRQGSIWIDTAFQSSTATTIVTRGSEQFRALVADEPGIRAIAAQLAGEVVVVWKGRAYRIR